MRTADLAGVELARWVARAIKQDIVMRDGVLLIANPVGWQARHVPHVCWAPHTDWAQGGPLIEQHDIYLDPNNARADHCKCRAVMDSKVKNSRSFASRVDGWGPTPLIAAMRALVASVYGDNVPDWATP